MLTLFLIMFGFVVIMILTCWGATIFLTSVFPIFNFKDDFIDYCIRTRGAPPSRRRLILSAYGACNYFFMTERTMDTHMPNGIRIVPNKNNYPMLLLQFASLVTAVLFWITAFFVFAIVVALF